MIGILAELGCAGMPVAVRASCREEVDLLNRSGEPLPDELVRQGEGIEMEDVVSGEFGPPE
jgi:hypothetical protein